MLIDQSSRWAAGMRSTHAYHAVDRGCDPYGGRLLLPRRQGVRAPARAPRDAAWTRQHAQRLSAAVLCPLRRSCSISLLSDLQRRAQAVRQIGSAGSRLRISASRASQQVVDLLAPEGALRSGMRSRGAGAPPVRMAASLLRTASSGRSPMLTCSQAAAIRQETDDAEEEQQLFGELCCGVGDARLHRGQPRCARCRRRGRAWQVDGALR